MTFFRILLAVWGMAAFAAHSTQPVPGVMVPRQEIVADRTLEMWSARWWMWAASFDGADSPVADRLGTRCGAGQEGEAFFLAGAYGSRVVNRTCTVPAGKYLFFPLVNYIVMPEDGAGNCEILKSDAREMTDSPSRLFAELDGKALPGVDAQRAAPENCFNLNAKSGGPKLMSASNGYWIMLRPLPKGRHTLHFGGVLPSLSQDITYTLRVE
jgi:hypothetical protein